MNNIFTYLSYLCLIVLIIYFTYSWRIYNYNFEYELLNYSERLWISRFNNSLQNYTAHSLFNVKVYVNDLEPLCFMIIINPQRYHFFIERGVLIYHPGKQQEILQHDAILKQYRCLPSNEFELAYLMPTTTTIKTTNQGVDQLTSMKNPKVICHRNLSYLIKHVYVNEVYSHNYNHFQKPLVVLSDVFKRLLKIYNIKKYIYTQINH